jgi:hypothetical protein
VAYRFPFLFDLLLAGDKSKRKLDISYPTNDFMKQVKMIDTFEEATMGIVIRHIKSFVLSSISCPSCLPVIPADHLPFDHEQGRPAGLRL